MRSLAQDVDLFIYFVTITSPTIQANLAVTPSCDTDGLYEFTSVELLNEAHAHAHAPFKSLAHPDTRDSSYSLS